MLLKLVAALATTWLCLDRGFAKQWFPTSRNCDSCSCAYLGTYCVMPALRGNIVELLLKGKTNVQSPAAAATILSTASNSSHSAAELPHSAALAP